MPVKPRYASTVVLFQGSGKGIKVYMIKRREDLAFLGGFYAFPGGALSRDDCSPIANERTRGLTNEKAGEILNSPIEEPYTALGFWTAGIRELFEEAGVLLAETEEGSSVPFQGREKLFHESRNLLHQRKMSFYDILNKENLYCAAQRLVHIDHWITPEFSPIRFDTRFFAARLPEGHEPSPFAGEAAEGLWIEPKKALEENQNGKMPMIYPTISSLIRVGTGIDL